MDKIGKRKESRCILNVLLLRIIPRRQRKGKDYSMRYIKEPSGDPVEIGECAGCGAPVWSDEAYYRYGDELVHATGHIAKIDTVNGKVAVSCLMAYVSEVCLEDEVAQLLGMERSA